MGANVEEQLFLVLPKLHVCVLCVVCVCVCVCVYVCVRACVSVCVVYKLF